jgi:hypothetical protein
MLGILPARGASGPARALRALLFFGVFGGIAGKRFD